MAAYTAIPIGPGRVATGMPQALYATEATTQTAAIGTPVKLVSGLVTDVTGASAGTDTAIAGVRVTKGMNLTATRADKRAGYIPLRQGNRLVGSLVGALAESSRGATVGFALDATTGFYTFSTAATHKPLKIVDWNSKYAVGDTLAVVEVEVV